MKKIFSSISLAALISLATPIVSLSIRQVEISSDVKQDLIPSFGSCYARNPAFQDVIYNHQAKGYHTTVMQLASLIENSDTHLDAMHFALEVYPMYDMVEATLTAAKQILNERPGDLHALYIQSIYLHATGMEYKFAHSRHHLHISSPSKARDLDKAIADIATRFSKPFEYALPDNFAASPDSSAVAIIIFGAPANQDLTPGKLLKGRLDKALQIRAKLPNAYFVCSGGAVHTATPESLSMQKYLLEAGIPQSDIGIDTSARDTIGNAINVASLLERRRLNTVILVTSDYHTHRSYLALSGVINKRRMQVSIVAVGAPQTRYLAEDGTLEQRMEVEKELAYRDYTRASGMFEYCDF